jgi:predicted transcriptional regulator
MRGWKSITRILNQAPVGRRLQKSHGPFWHRNYKTTSLKEKNMQTAKQAAKQIIDHVSDQATWDDIMYELYVKQKIEKGLSAVEEGRVISNEDAKKRLLGNEG